MLFIFPISIVATVVDSGPLVVDIMCVSVLVGTGLDLDVVNVAGVIAFVGVIEDIVGEIEVIEVVRVPLRMSVTGVSVAFVELMVFRGVVFRVLSSVDASVATDTTCVVGVVNISFEVGD